MLHLVESFGGIVVGFGLCHDCSGSAETQREIDRHPQLTYQYAGHVSGMLYATVVDVLCATSDRAEITQHKSDTFEHSM
jgi:hypothetical protein